MQSGISELNALPPHTKDLRAVARGAPVARSTRRSGEGRPGSVRVVQDVEIDPPPGNPPERAPSGVSESRPALGPAHLTRTQTPGNFALPITASSQPFERRQTPIAG